MIRPVSAAELRRLFNEHVLPQIERNDLLDVVMDDGHPTTPRALEPFCTRSQEVAYLNPITGQEVARVHRYVRRDGTIGASGKPDPKKIVLFGEVIVLDEWD